MSADYAQAVRSSGVLQRLAAFDPHLAGTLPLGIAVAGSDVDVLCQADDPGCFAAAIWQSYAEADGFSIHQWASGERAVVARFAFAGWPFEIFGSRQPVREQRGWRHFEVEARLLALGGERLRAAVLAQRRAGLKTEPAFARVLGLPGDPYAAMLDLHGRSDRGLRDLIARARGFSAGRSGRGSSP